MNYAGLLQRPINDIEFVKSDLSCPTAHGMHTSGERAGECVAQRAITIDRVLITGGCGSIGSEIARKLRGVAGHVYAGDRNERALAEIEADEHVTPILLDVTRPQSVHSAIERIRPDLVIHCAAYKHVPVMEDYPEEAIETNFYGTKIVVDALARPRTDARFVFVSTDKAASNRCVMGCTKFLAERYVQTVAKRHTRGMTIVRFGNVIGSSGSILETWTRQLTHCQPLTVCEGATRYFCTLGEAASLAIKASTVDGECPILTMDMGEPIEMMELARRFLDSKGMGDYEIEVIPLRNGDAPSERLAGEGEELVEHEDGLEVVGAS